MHFALANLAAFPSSSGVKPHGDKQRTGLLAAFRQCIIMLHPLPPFRIARDSSTNHAKLVELTALRKTVVRCKMIPKDLRSYSGTYESEFMRKRVFGNGTEFWILR